MLNLEINLYQKIQLKLYSEAPVICYPIKESRHA